MLNNYLPYGCHLKGRAPLFDQLLTYFAGHLNPQFPDDEFQLISSHLDLYSMQDWP
jgi:hypothetical protein